MDNIHPIHTERDYERALKDVETYFDNEPAPGSPEEERFEVLLALIKVWEDAHYPIDPPDPVDAIKFRMEQAGLTPKDLMPAIGRLNRVYEVLNGKRSLTLPMIWKLNDLFGIPLESLIRPPKAA
ncbi:MAG: transcriptional regulator [Azoarcus sp.]|jgi:HTH-type transcriptional regulator/antitoxin HigA|nr:transcriptional regulator [Azoarcus sp.]